MRFVTRLLLLAVATMLFAGCATNYYNVPRESYEKKVKVLGVAPILLDTDSDIRHPEKGEVIRIVREANRKNERELVDILKDNGDYSAVRFLDEEPEMLYSAILSRRERRDDAGVVYNKYFYKPEELRKLVARHNVDAVMLVTVSGVTALEKIFSNTLTSYLEENYNNLIMTAQILDGDATLLWEYPNFRQKFITFSKLFDLQYADFEEARANLTDQVRIKHKSVAGIGRAFTRTEGSTVKSGKQVSTLYNAQFLAMSSFLHYFRNPFAEKKEEKKPETAVRPLQDEYAPRPVAVPVGAVPPPTLPLPPPPTAATAKTSPVASATPQTPAAQPQRREFEPVAPAEPGRPETQIIREPDFK